MTIWRVGADVLARSRFQVSALAEVVATLLVLNGKPNRPGQLARPAEDRAAFRAHLATDPVAAAWLGVAIRPNWIADVLCTPPLPGETFAEELNRVRAAPAAEVSEGDPAFDRPDMPGRVAGLLGWVWSEVVGPDWPRRSRAFEADVVARTRRLSTGGWAAAVDDMRPGLRWLGEGRLQINAHDYPPHDVSGGELLFIPTTSARGWVGWDPPHRWSVIYGCSGLLAEGRTHAPDALRRLVGPARAALLTLLDGPMSTTQLVAVTGFALGAVGDHLRVLYDAQLVRRRRAGRSVLYYRTADGDRLVELTRTATP